MKIKTSRTEKAFFIGMGVEYLSTRKGGFIANLGRALRSQQRYYEAEKNRVVDPYNRTVE